MTSGDDSGHGDAEAALSARHELGARYDAELVEGFAERIEQAVQRRVDDQLVTLAGIVGVNVAHAWQSRS